MKNNKKMHYKIINNPTYTNTMKIGLEVQPENEPLQFFFTSMRLHKYPEFINDILNDRGYLGDPQGVLFYNDLDNEDFATGNVFNKEEVKVYHHVFGESIISRKTFIQMVYDFSCKLLEVYGNDGNIPENWKLQMEKSLKELSLKMEH
ncbi:MAG: hypothetical protein V7K88_03190 [Nostoc sp.]|uniref:hypothetical protein n=1 Tax=Nostoc sp. TaxID=1180 RepID=UPI002FFBC81E